MGSPEYAGREAETEGGISGKGTWKHAAFHVATTIATPAAYAPLPFALASLGWPLGVSNLVSATLATWYSSILIASLWKWNGEKHLTYRHLARFWGYWSIAFFQQGSSASKSFKAFNALGTIAFSFGDAMLPEIQNTVREPAKMNMYKSISAAYTVIVLTYWQLAFSGYWAFGSEVQPYILASLSTPEWTVVMANLFAAIQICGCFQIYCRPTYAYLEERIGCNKSTSHSPLRNHLARLSFTSIYMILVTLIAAAMPFFGDFVSICGAIGFTPLDFVFPALAYLKAGSIDKNSKLGLFMRPLNILIVTWFSMVAILGCIGAVRFIVEDIKNYKFFYDM
ncbi:Amino acid transporter, transmembrane domain [Sesbania bispinosa]|nr:Amino acid transporter, transmembrane domain [Sesbania bispinosa]